MNAHPESYEENNYPVDSVPEFYSRDYSVKTYLVKHYPWYYRIFLPLYSGEIPIPWRYVTPKLTARTSFLDIRQNHPNIEHNYGFVPSAWLRTLLVLLTNGDDSTILHYGHWPGYTSRKHPHRYTPIQPTDTFLTELELTFHVNTIDQIINQYTEFDRAQIPSVVWDTNRSFTLAQWVYDDSLYLSTGNDVLALLPSNEYEVWRVQPDDPVCSVGDVF